MEGSETDPSSFNFSIDLILFQSEKKTRRNSRGIERDCSKTFARRSSSFFSLSLSLSLFLSVAIHSGSRIMTLSIYGAATTIAFAHRKAI